MPFRKFLCRIFGVVMSIGLTVHNEVSQKIARGVIMPPPPVGCNAEKQGTGGVMLMLKSAVNSLPMPCSSHNYPCGVPKSVAM
jgi:hypothetical protein